MISVALMTSPQVHGCKEAADFIKMYKLLMACYECSYTACQVQFEELVKKNGTSITQQDVEEWDAGPKWIT
jgi:hypothetical protein